LWSGRGDAASDDKRLLGKSPYRGPLNATQFAEGVLVSLRRWRGPYSDVGTLAEHGSYGTAVALGALAYEEAGKGPETRESSAASLSWRDSEEAMSMTPYHPGGCHVGRLFSWPTSGMLLEGGCSEKCGAC
jgi:hypothetical protein